MLWLFDHRGCRSSRPISPLPLAIRSQRAVSEHRKRPSRCAGLSPVVSCRSSRLLSPLPLGHTLHVHLSQGAQQWLVEFVVAVCVGQPCRRPVMPAPVGPAVVAVMDLSESSPSSPSTIRDLDFTTRQDPARTSRTLQERLLAPATTMTALTAVPGRCARACEHCCNTSFMNARPMVTPAAAGFLPYLFIYLAAKT